MRFIHIADAHLDTLFAGRSEALRQRLRDASRTAFRRAVAAAIAHEVHAFLIAGDLFDGERLSFETERFLLAELERLGAAGIDVVYVTGNHDPGGSRSRAGRLAWPSNVHVMGEAEPRSVLVRDAAGEPVGHVTGAGHESAAVTDDLSLAYPAPAGTLPHVALLHTQVVSARGSGEHERYAPSELARLVRSGHDYWAIGHVHQRQLLSEHPQVHYPGNLQGRNPRESGAKGGLLVDLTEAKAPIVTFLDFAPIRWETIVVGGIETCDQLRLLVRVIQAAWERERSGDQGEPGVEWLVRVELEGPSLLRDELLQKEDRETLEDELAMVLGALQVEVRPERVRPLQSVEEHLERQDVLGESLRLAQALRSDLADVAAALEIEEGELAGFDAAEHGSLNEYLQSLLDDAGGEIVQRLLLPRGEGGR